MGERRLRDRPASAVAWVKATIVGAGLTGAIACGPSIEDQAPTCGPCCHGGGPECEEMHVGAEEVDGYDESEGDGDSETGDETLLEAEPNEEIDTAPTCGPCCHGTGGPECDRE